MERGDCGRQYYRTLSYISLFNSNCYLIFNETISFGDHKCVFFNKKVLEDREIPTAVIPHDVN